jgi:capsule polysaccharide export protein KpsE/RkpR
MGKTVRKEPKEDTKLSKLKNKLADRKQQITRLKATIRALEKKLEKYEKGITGTSDKGKPAKPVKLKAIEVNKEDAKRELMEKLKSQFSSKGITNED